MTYALRHALAALLVCALPAACTEARAVRRVVRTDDLTERGLVFVAFDDGSLEARAADTGTLRFRDASGSGTDLGFGSHPAETVLCPVRALAGGHLLVVRPSNVEVLRETDGTIVLKLRRRRAGRPPVCPAAAPDGTFVDAVPAFHGSGELVKYDVTGRVLWRHANPDIGPLTGAIQVDSRTGDVLATSDTHVLVVSPSGRTNWVREHGRR